jgi:Ni,Fe-hydrogenase III small subunit
MNIHIKNIGDCQKCGFVLSSFLNDTSKYGIRKFRLTKNPKECDLLLIVGCLSTSQQKPLLDFFKKMPLAKNHRILSFGNCGTDQQDLFSFPEDQNLENRAIPIHDLSEILAIDEVVEGCPPKIEDFLETLNKLE